MTALDLKEAPISGVYWKRTVHGELKGLLCDWTVNELANPLLRLLETERNR